MNSWLVLFWPIGRFIMVSPAFSHLHFSFKHRLLTVAGCLATVDGIFLAGLPFSMESVSKIRKRSPGINPLIEPDYSVYTLVELFRARYWIDIKLARQSSLENEIQKRCEYIRERTNDKAWAAAGSTTPFKPYGLMRGVVFLCFSIGPFVSVRFLNMINLISDVNGDKVSLAGLWALLMLPVVVIVSMIGGRMDAERVINWFHLDGRKEDANKRSFGATINTL